MFGIVRNIFVIAVLAGLWFACKPFQKWLRKRKTPWLILGTGYALLIFLCSFIVPETTLIGFDSPWLHMHMPKALERQTMNR